MKTNYNYRALKAGNRESNYFDFANGKTPQTAIAAVKRKNSPDWQDCNIWVQVLMENGEWSNL